MSLPKTFTAGERLFAADLNDNFEYFEDEVIRLDGDIAAVPVPAGIGSNVVSTTKTDAFNSSSSSFTALTGLSASIIPSSTSSKILVIGHISLSNSDSFVGASWYRLLRDSTAISVGDTASNRGRATGSFFGGINRSNGANNVGTTGAFSFVFVDSPGTDSSVTYSCEVAVSGGTIRVNQTAGDSDAANNPRTTSSITVIEVAA